MPAEQAQSIEPVMKLKSVLLGLGALLAAFHASAAMVVADNFGDGLTAGWTPQRGSISESGGLMTGPNVSLAVMDGVSATRIGVDAVSRASVSYVALLLNYTSLSDYLLVKLQDNTGDGLFDRVFFYHGNPNNGNIGVSGSYFFDLSSAVETTYFEASVNNLTGEVTAMVGATGDVFSGTLTNAYAGTGVGLGFYNSGAADNFYIERLSVVPEPSSMALVLMSLGLLGSSFRHRRTTGDSWQPDRREVTATRF